MKGNLQMPVNKNQWLRFQSILAYMRKKRYVNYRLFMKDMQRSNPTYYIAPKTFTRDMQNLKKQLGAPVEYDQHHKGFYLSDPDWNSKYMPTTSGDLKLLVLSEKISQTFMPPQLSGELNNAINALLMKQEKAIPEEMNLENFQIINPVFAPQVDPELFLEVYNSWETMHYLKITYLSSQNHQSVKLIEPHVLAWNNGSWYVKGFLANDNGVPCNQPFPVRVFALHRIQKAEMLPRRFFSFDDDIKRIKKSNLFDFQLIDEVEIEFFPPYLKQMEERFSSFPDAIVSKNENSMLVRLKDIPEYTAIQLVLLAGGNARIHKPASLRESLGKIAQTIMKNLK